MPTFPSTNLPVDNSPDAIRRALIDLLGKVNANANAVTQFGDVQGGNYTEFESGGVMRFAGDAVVWNDMVAPAANLRPGASSPTFAAIVGGIYGYRFDVASTQNLYGAFEIVHDYMEGSDLDIHVHWSPTTTNTGNIVWNVEYCVANIDGTFSSTTSAAMTPTAAPGVVGQHVLSEVTTISGEGLTIGAIVLFNVFRQNGGTDTFTGNAFLHSVGAHYQLDTAGSRAELVK